MELYDRIKERRVSLGMSQETLAEKLGYKDRSTIAKIESGDNDITQSKILAFAKALDTTVPYLMGWEEVDLKDTEIIDFHAATKKPATISDDGLKKLDADLVKLLSSLTPDEVPLARNIFQGIIDARKK